MLQIKVIKKVLVVTMAIFLLYISSLYALMTPTHKMLNEYIAVSELNGFNLDSYLKNTLQLQNGVSEVFKYGNESKYIFQWLGEGGIKEDDPFTPSWKPDDLPSGIRFFNHFHNPLTDAGYWLGDSSIAWAFEPVGDQAEISGDYSWHDVREYLYKALTAVDDIDREENFAKTFRGLGQLMHLVQDLSVPEHTRNDAHVFLYV